MKNAPYCIKKLLGGITNVRIIFVVYFLTVLICKSANECSSELPQAYKECGVALPVSCDPRPDNGCLDEDGGSSFCTLTRTSVPVCKSITDPDANSCPTCPDNETYECGTVNFYLNPGCSLTDDEDRVESWYQCGC